MNQMHYNQEKSPKRTPANVARKAFWDAALGDNSKLANLAKAAITEAEQQAKVREWVGLTDGELRELEAKFNAERVRTSDEEYLVIYPGDYADWQRAIESKLREKNAGQPAADADPNAPWLTEAHILCTDMGIPLGHITERIRVLRERLNVPDDYVLVPVEPTQEMLAAGTDACVVAIHDGPEDVDTLPICYRAMLAAAPKPQATTPDDHPLMHSRPRQAPDMEASE